MNVSQFQGDDTCKLVAKISIHVKYVFYQFHRYWVVYKYTVHSKNVGKIIIIGKKVIIHLYKKTPLLFIFIVELI